MNHGFGETHGPRHRRANRIQVPNVSSARLTLYCGRIYKIRRDGIPPFTYARTFWSVASGGIADSICELVGFIGLPLPSSLSCHDSYLRHASSTNRRPGQNVAFCFLPAKEPACNTTLTRARQSPTIDSNVSQIVKRTIGQKSSLRYQDVLKNQCLKNATRMQQT